MFRRIGTKDRFHYPGFSVEGKAEFPFGALFVEYESAENASLHPIDQARRFLSVLMHDDHDAWYGLHISYTTCAGRTWQPNVLRIVPDRLSSFDVTAFDGFDSYVSVNGFCGRSRAEGNLRHVNSLMYDLDVEAAHSGELSGRALERAKGDGAALVYDLVERGLLPKPTMVVDTGRGLQVHYVLERTASYRNSLGEVNRPLLAVVKRVRDGLASLLRAACSAPGCQLSLDEAASDLSRVCRIPGSTNTKSDTRAALLHDDGPLWSLEGLLAFLPQAQGPRKPASGTSPVSRPRRPDMDEGASGLLCRLRMSKLQELRDLREASGGCLGTRNELLFCYVNAAFSLYGTTRTLELGRKFNDGFSRPLPDSEVRASVSGISRNGVYRFGRRRLAEHVALSDEEDRAIGFFDLPATKEMRRRAEKRRRAEAKAERDAKVLSFAKEGLSYGEVARMVGVSRRTVCSVLSKAGYARRRHVGRKASTLSVPMLRRGVRKASIIRLSDDLEVAGVFSLSANFCPRTYCERDERRFPCVPGDAGSWSLASFPSPVSDRTWPTGQVDGKIRPKAPS